MNPFFESFQKELGKRTAQGIALGVSSLISLVAALLIPENMSQIRILLLCLTVLLLSLLSSGLLIFYLSYQKSKQDEFKDYKFNMIAKSWMHKDSKTKRACAKCKVDNIFSPLSFDTDINLFVCPKCGDSSKLFPLDAIVSTGNGMVIIEQNSLNKPIIPLGKSSQAFPLENYIAVIKRP